jgi:oligopeptide/dipeptide ABC transporter ATP-binding protein
MALLEVKNLKVAYRLGDGALRAVDDVSFAIEPAKTLGIVGESGCGKTTLAYALLRLLPPNGVIESGQILFHDQDLVTLTDDEVRALRWKKIAMIFQSAMSSLDPVKRVGDLVIEAARTHDAISKEEARSRAVELFRLVGLEPAALKAYPHELSGGMKQRAVIAMSLICRPELVIADEPTTALDVIVQDQILQRLRVLAEQLHLALVVISHDLGVIAEVCDQVVVMYAGQIVEYGHAVAIFKHPKHPYTIGLMNSFPSLTDDRMELIPMPGNPPDLLHPPVGCRFATRCPLAAEICLRQDPPLIAVADGHLSRCHFADTPAVDALRKARGTASIVEITA